MSTDRYVSRGGVLVPRAMGYDVVSPWNFNKRRMAGWSTWIMPIDEDHQVGAWDLSRLRLESRNAYRNHPLARAIVDSVCNAVVGSTSLTPMPRTSSPEWNDAAARSRSMVQMDWMCIHHTILDGEIFYVLKSETGQELPVEAECVTTPADRINDPLCVNGAEVSAGGYIYGWWIARRNAYGTVDNTTCEFVDSRDIIHHRLQWREDSVRGIPYLAPVLSALIDYKEYREALRLKVKAESKRTAAIISDSEEGAGNLGNRFGGQATANAVAGENSDATQAGISYENVNDLEIYHFRPGEKIESLAMENPGQYHVQFTESEAQEICAAVGVAWEWVRKMFSTSYIAGQASIISSQPTIERFQGTLESSKKQREWNWRIAKAIKDGELSQAPTARRGKFDVSEWYKVEWTWPPMMQLDRGREENADAQAFRNGTESLTMQAQRKGVTFDHILDQRATDARKIMRKAGFKDTDPIPLWLLAPTLNNVPPTVPTAEPDGDESTPKRKAS